MPDSVRAAFDELPRRYNAIMGIGLNAVFQWTVTGPGGGQWYVVLEEGRISVHEGEAPKPDLRLTVGDQDWLDIVNGKLKYTAAYACGKVRMEGPVPLHKKVDSLFVSTHHEPAKSNLEGVLRGEASDEWKVTAQNDATGHKVVEVHPDRIAADEAACILRNNGFRVTVTPPQSAGLPPIEFSPAA